MRRRTATSRTAPRSRSSELPAPRPSKIRLREIPAEVQGRSAPRSAPTSCSRKRQRAQPGGRPCQAARRGVPGGPHRSRPARSGRPSSTRSPTPTSCSRRTTPQAIEIHRAARSSIEPDHVESLRPDGGDPGRRRAKDEEAQAYMARKLPEDAELDPQAQINLGISRYNEGNYERPPPRSSRRVLGRATPTCPTRSTSAGLVHLNQQKNDQAAGRAEALPRGRSGSRRRPPRRKSSSPTCESAAGLYLASQPERAGARVPIAAPSNREPRIRHAAARIHHDRSPAPSRPGLGSTRLPPGWLTGLELSGVLIAACARRTASARRRTVRTLDEPVAPTPAGPTFTRLSTEIGLDFVHDHGWTGERLHAIETMGGGGGFLDFDNDGWLDLYLVQSGPAAVGHEPGEERASPPTNRLFRNLGDGTFADVTTGSGLDDSWLWHGRLLRRRRRRRLGRRRGHQLRAEPVLPQPGRRHLRGSSAPRPASTTTRWGASCAFADYDLDGDLDLYVTNYYQLLARAPPQLRQPRLPLLLPARLLRRRHRPALPQPGRRHVRGRHAGRRESGTTIPRTARGSACAGLDFDDDGDPRPLRRQRPDARTSSTATTAGRFTRRGDRRRARRSTRAGCRRRAWASTRATTTATARLDL